MALVESPSPGPGPRLCLVRFRARYAEDPGGFAVINTLGPQGTRLVF